MGGSSPYDFARARRDLVAAFGRDTILALHRPLPALDVAVLVVHGALFLGLGYLLGSLRPLGLAWLACLVAQGFVILAFGYVLHEFFVHRHVGGRRFSYWAGLVTGILAYLLRTPYAEIHHDHHAYTGTDRDEAYKDDLDRRWKRLLFLTPIGYLLAFRGKLAREHAVRFPSPEGSFALDAAAQRRARVERRFLAGFWILLAAGAVVAPSYVLYGYLAPLLLVVPLVNVVRTVLEHAETNPENRFHCATFYRTGPLTRLLFLWDAGDCHLVHHIFPNIPFYRMGRAVDLFRPFLVSQGVRERRSLPALLHGFFVRLEPHRAPWSA